MFSGPTETLLWIACQLASFNLKINTSTSNSIFSCLFFYLSWKINIVSLVSINALPWIPFPFPQVMTENGPLAFRARLRKTAVFVGFKGLYGCGNICWPITPDLDFHIVLVGSNRRKLYSVSPWLKLFGLQKFWPPRGVSWTQVSFWHLWLTRTTPE